MFDNDILLISKYIDENPELIKFIKRKYLNDELIEFVINKNPELFKYITKPSDAIIQLAVKLDGNNIYHLKKEDLTEELCEIAVSQTPTSILYIPPSRRYTRLKQLACKGDNSLIQHFQNDFEKIFLVELIKESPNCIKYIHNPTEWMIELAILKDPNVILYFDKLPNKIKKSVKEKWNIEV